MAASERCLLVHGHFYQPPRENPWLGRIEPQQSAAPWDNWNQRIADECYLPMARSRIRDSDGRVVDLYNNYAHISFNFGPTLLSWLADRHPPLLRRLAEAAAIDNTFPMAQAYNHMMLPLADARDRHTQILWGLREFRHRFGFDATGMWLPECGIDPETIRALIDHGVKFVILSPHQASQARPFGDAAWRDASMGAVDTRRAYRLFEIDGGGRTHFNRWLDVIFYTPGLNLKVSFDHILNRPADLARELENCYRPDSSEAQLVSIVTDGEIYGHHEKGGEEALARLFRDIAPSLNLRIVSALEFIRDHPPTWEVRLWNGEDGKGSSWSCSHGMGRWHRDCGCGANAGRGWRQGWREPLRNAFDIIRERVRRTVRQELGGLVRDVDDAVNDAISILLAPGVASRRRFLERHAQRRLLPEEIERLWRLLEARRNAMLMYTSCGWFFDELSGIEPVQNMRYALRAAELIQPWNEEDLSTLLERELAKAKSNLPEYGDGGEIFRRLVLPSRYSGPELAAAMAACQAAGLASDCLSWRMLDATGPIIHKDDAGRRSAWGAFVCHDERLDRFIRTAWVARLDEFDNSGVGLHDYQEVQGDPYRNEGEIPLRAGNDFSWLEDRRTETRKLKRQELLDRFGEFGIFHIRLPEAVRCMLYRLHASRREEELIEAAAHLGAKAVPDLALANRSGARLSDVMLRNIANTFERGMLHSLLAAITAMEFSPKAADHLRRSMEAAGELGLRPDQSRPEEYAGLAATELLEWLNRLAEPGWLETLTPTPLPDGGEWLMPQSPCCHAHRHPLAGVFAEALGKGLALLRRRLAARPEALPGAALLLLPLPELLEYAGEGGLSLRQQGLLGIDFWDFLDLPLANLTAADPAGLMAGEAGDRLRRTGVALGFSADAVDKRILAAIRRRYAARAT